MHRLICFLVVSFFHAMKYMATSKSNLSQTMVASVRSFQTKGGKSRFSWSRNLHQWGRKSGCFCAGRRCDYAKVKLASFPRGLGGQLGYNQRGQPASMIMWRFNHMSFQGILLQNNVQIIYRGCQIILLLIFNKIILRLYKIYTGPDTYGKGGCFI